VDEADRPHRDDLRAVGAADDKPLRGQALTAPAAALFRFIQVELPWPLGPPDGRHVLRATGEADEAAATRPIAHVVVLASIDAPRRGSTLRSRGRTRPVEPEPGPTPVASGRATVISVRDPFADETAARTWLDGAGEAELEQGLDVLGRMLHAHRIATADPWVAPLARERLIAGRIGYGAGEQVADGRWMAARELTEPGGPARGARRRRGLGGSEARLAALLAGTEQPLAAEELTLRARLDLDRGRPREAALQLLVALDAGIAGLAADRLPSTFADRMTALRERRASTAAAAQAALTGTPSLTAQAEVAETLGMLEAALRARLVDG
jgi:hypothetical protein